MSTIGPRQVPAMLCGMLLLAATLASAADLHPVAPRPPRTHTAVVLLHTGEFTALGGALTAVVGGVLLTDPFWHGGEGCGLMMATGANACGTSTFWLGAGLTSAGALVAATSIPLMIVGVALPRDRGGSVERQRADVMIAVSGLGTGLQVSGRLSPL